MSRLAKQPIPIPNGVEIKKEEKTVSVKGPKGQLKHELGHGISIEIDDKAMTVLRDPSIDKKGNFHGLHWAILRNMVQGCSEGFTKKLELVGVGYRANLQGGKLDLQVGQSHPLQMEIPEGINVAVEKGTKITITGVSKQDVGLFAAQVQAKNPPEPYKGKGIRFEGQYVRKKAGKAAKAGK